MSRNLGVIFVDGSTAGDGRADGDGFTEAFARRFRNFHGAVPYRTEDLKSPFSVGSQYFLFAFVNIDRELSSKGGAAGARLSVAERIETSKVGIVLNFLSSHTRTPSFFS
ncbi:polymerase delta-interacting protein 3 [Striga asiatica]|uniref:Polymerase delta-interacting protein 3 n=1 Tax=Striga asiatica TaxID=4170 RepID=A0A5A7PDF1_STRAF|nr:polymerase delta-interacting protein 3 [Striga asiatica]